MKDNFNILFENRFPKFGINKSREIYRLIKELSQITKKSEISVLTEIKENSYEAVKTFLLKKRYSQTFNKTELSSFYLPKYEIDVSCKANTEQLAFYPSNIYYETDSQNSPLFTKLKSLFPKSSFTEIESLKSFLKTVKNNSAKTFISSFNKRCENIFLVKEKYDFFKKCPCTTGVINCGYSIMNLGMGCPYECSYCFLQGYQNIPGILIPYNIEDYLDDEKIVSSARGFFNYKRIGSGEFTDSLVFDKITDFSKQIISFFKKRKNISFEFKTKSLEIKNLLQEGGQSNIVAAWSVNSLQIQKENEFKTPAISARLFSAKECALAGFSTAFHFDPIIHYENWKNGYKEAVDMIFDTVPNESIKWISLGTLRMPAAQKQIMENRFENLDLLNGELLLGQDYKLRYHKDLRIEIYKYINNLIKSKKSNAIVYLCMEDTDVWKKSGML